MGIFRKKRVQGVEYNPLKPEIDKINLYIENIKIDDNITFEIKERCHEIPRISGKTFIERYKSTFEEGEVF